MTEQLRQRRPREKSKPYKGYIAALPCVLCLAKAEVCHVRYSEACPECSLLQNVDHLFPGMRGGGYVGNLGPCTPCQATGYRYGKRPTGASEKPSDWWCVPLCPVHHRLGNEAQHQHNERAWHEAQGLDALALCVALQDAYNTALSRSDAIEAGAAVIEEIRNVT